jgi:hypothetical protein
VKFVYYPSGAVLCCATDDCGSIVVLCTDPELSLQQRADKAQQQVQEILDRLKADEKPQLPALIEVHAAPAHRRESSD